VSVLLSVQEGEEDEIMTNLTDRERELVALGAAMGSNCIPCMEYHIPAARNAGLSDARIADAVRLADKVRQVPARKVLGVSMAMLAETTSDAGAGRTVDSCAQPAAGAEKGSPCCG
jgi:AhpD family alkylhydroperoxidase